MWKQSAVGVYVSSAKSALYNNRRLERMVKIEVERLLKDTGIDVRRFSRLGWGRGAGGGMIDMFSYALELYHSHLAWLPPNFLVLPILRIGKSTILWLDSVLSGLRQLYYRLKYPTFNRLRNPDTTIHLEIICKNNGSRNEWRSDIVDICIDLVDLTQYLQTGVSKKFNLISAEFQCVVASTQYNAPNRYGIVDVWNVVPNDQSWKNTKNKLIKIRDKNDLWLTSIDRQVQPFTGKTQYKPRTRKMKLI